MKSFVAVIGLLTIAQWLFVGLLYGILEVQDKSSPETMNKLHGFPVIGGYFPEMKVPTEKEEAQKYGDSLRERLVDARRQWSLPASYNDEEFVALMTDIKSRGDLLKTESRKLEKLKLEVRSMVDEIDKREKAVVAKQGGLTIRERELLKSEAEVNLTKSKQDRVVAEQEQQHNRKIARWLNTMTSEAAAEKLMKGRENETAMEEEDRYRQAAMLLALMEDEQASKVIELLDPVDWVKIEEMKRSLPIAKK
ncbi:MAG: hypothetical protein ACI97A_000822 [Planctomycetota bacterium]|jgi:hypothetical protein